MKRAFLKYILIVALFGVALTFILSGCQTNTVSQYLVTFDPNGGEFTSDVTKSTWVEAGGSVSAPEADPVRAGYDFLGWFYNSDATDQVNFNTFKAVGTTVLYAGWIDSKLYPHDIKLSIVGEGVASADKASAVYGETVTLSINEVEGYVFDRIEVNGVSSTEKTFTMPAEVANVKVIYVLELYSVTIRETDYGSVSCSQAEAYMGDMLTFTATPNAGYYLSALQVSKSTLDNSNLSMEMPGYAVYAIPLFKEIDYEVTYGVSVSTVDAPEGASVTLSNNKAAAGQYVYADVTVPKGYVLSTLTYNGISFNDYFIMPSAAVTVSATFAVSDTDCTVSFTQTEGGTIALNGDYYTNSTPKCGETAHITVIPSDGYELDYIDVNGERYFGTTFVLKSASVTVKPYFIPIIHSVTVQDYACAEISVSLTAARAGRLVSYSVTVTDPDFYYVENTLKVNGVSPESGTYFVMPAANAVVSATFARYPEGSGNIGTITVSDMVNGEVTVSAVSAKAGAYVRASVTPSDGYTLTAGSLKYNGIPFENGFTMPVGNVVVSASFERLYTITPYIGLDGIFVPDRLTAIKGERVYLSYYSASNYVVNGATFVATRNGNATPVSISNNTLVMPDSDIVLSATFQSVGTVANAITVVTPENGSLELSVATAVFGAQVTVKAAPADGFTLSRVWYEGVSTEISAEIYGTFKMPAQAINIYAEFIASEVSDVPTVSEAYEKQKGAFSTLGANFYYSEAYSDIASFLNNASALSCFKSVAVFDYKFDFYVFECDASRLSEAVAVLYESFHGEKGNTKVKSFNGNTVIVSSVNSPDDDLALFYNGYVTADDYIFSERADGTYSIITYTGKDETVSIPESYNGKAISKINSYAFSSVASTLKAISLSNVTELAPFALCNLTKLTVLDLRAVTSLGKGALYGCSSVTSFTVDMTNTVLFIRNSVLYSKSGSTSSALEAYPIGTVSSTYTVLNTCNEIKPYAFYGAEALVTVDLSLTSVKKIGDYAFYGCKLLTNVSLDRVSYVGNFAFYNAEALSNVNLTALTSIGESAFSVGNTDLTLNLNNTIPAFLGTDGGIIAIKEGAKGNFTAYVRYVAYDKIRSSSVWRPYSKYIQISQTDLIGSKVAVIYELPLAATYVATERLDQAGLMATEPTAPTMEGYTFAGWYTDEALTVPFGGFSTKITSTIRLYAKFI